MDLTLTHGNQTMALYKLKLKVGSGSLFDIMYGFVCVIAGIRKTKDMAIHSPPVTSSAKTPGRMLPLRPLRYKPELIYAGTSQTLTNMTT